MCLANPNLISIADDALRRLDRVGTHLALPRRAVLFSEGQPSEAVFVVYAGQLKLSTTSPEARTMILRLAGPGDFLGLSAALDELPYEVTAETLERCIFNRIPRADFLGLLQSDSGIGSKTAQALAKEYREAFLDARRMALSGSAAGRIARLLLDSASTTASGILEVHIAAVVTHEDLANMAGTSRETVTRLLNKFERDHLIARHESTLVILDHDQLSHLTK